MKNILITIGVTLLLVFGAATIYNGPSYHPSTRIEGGQSSTLVSPGNFESETVTLQSANISTDTGFMIVDLSNASSKWPHVAGDNKHINILSVMITLPANASFAGYCAFGYLSDVTVDHSTFNPLHTIPFNGHLNLASQYYADYTFHPMSCKDDTFFGASKEMVARFQSDTAITGPDSATYLPADGDLVAFVDLSAGSIYVSITVQYVLIDD